MLVRTPDGRTLEVLDTGGDGLPCLFHNGTPGGPVAHDAAIDAARGAGLRWITYARPGYGDSSALPGRTVAQATEDATTVLGALGIDRFVTYGWSGGGPHALACAAVMPGRCLAAASVAGVAPYDAEGLDFLAGMGEDNVEEFGLAVEGRDAVTPFLEVGREGLVAVTADDVAAQLQGLLSEVDRAEVTGDFADYLAASFRAAVRVGIDGWLDDDLAFAQPWGFELSWIRTPVAVWQGGQDLMVPIAHGKWLVAHLPGVRAHLEPQHGHLSVALGHLPAIFRELRDLATA